MTESRLTVYDESSPGRAMLAVPRPASSGHLRMPSVEELSVMSTLAKAIAGSKMYPGFTTEPQAMAGMLLAYDIRRPFSQVLRNAYMIEGRLSLAAQYIAGLVMDAPGCEMRVTEQTAEQCTVTFRRPGWTSEQTLTYTMADAQKAQLDGKAIWKKYPREMLVNRAFGIVARTHFPDVAAGMYTPEEVEDFDRPVMRAAISPQSQPEDVGLAGTDASPAMTAGDDHQQAMRRLYYAAGQVGIERDDVKQFIADLKRIPVEDVPSRRDWSLPFIGWATTKLQQRGAEWVTDRQRDDETVDAEIVETGMSGGVRRTLRPGEFVDRETGEIVPAEDAADDERFPSTPASLLSDEDMQPGRRNPDEWTR